MSNPESNMADVTDAEAAPARAELIERLGRRAEMFTRLLSQQYWLPRRAHVEGLRNDIRSALAALTSDDVKDRIAELERALAIKEAMFSVEAEQHVTWMERYLAAEAQLRLSSGTENGVKALVEALGDNPEKLANEAELVATTQVSATKVLMWADDHGKRIAAIVRAAIALTRRT